MVGEATQTIWHVGTMAEGDTRSTICIKADVLGDQVEDFVTALHAHPLVMDITLWHGSIHVKLDIGDLNSKVMPWASRKPPINLVEQDQVYQQIYAEAEMVALAAHQILVHMVPGIHPVPIFQRDWSPRAPLVETTSPVHAY